jgi:hypothetical protein
VNLDERGWFDADVRDPGGRTVYTIKIGYGEDEDCNPIEDGFMRHTDDVQGLHKYLIDMGVMNENQELLPA